MEKPTVLFHSSQDKNIEEFEPRKESYRDPEEGPVVFASSEKAIASMFLVPTLGGLGSSGRFRWDEGEGLKSVFFYVTEDEINFRKSDKGGAIYSLPSDTFETDLTKGLKELEWVSKIPVKPIGKEDFESGLEAMMNLEVQVFFVDHETYKRIRSSEDNGRSILKGLISENQKLGINPISFE